MPNSRGCCSFRSRRQSSRRRWRRFERRMC